MTGVQTCALPIYPPSSRASSLVLILSLHPSFNSITSLEPNASPAGLSGEAARSALERHGPNIFATERAPRVIALLLGALLNPFNVILLVLAIVNIATGDKATFTVMVVMVMASTGLRFVFFLLQKKKT